MADARLSFAESLTEGVSIEAAKPAEDGRGVILRLNETMGRRCLARVRLGRHARSAALCDLLENDLEPLQTSGVELLVPLRPRQIRTVRVLY